MSNVKHTSFFPPPGKPHWTHRFCHVCTDIQKEEYIPSWKHHQAQFLMKTWHENVFTLHILVALKHSGMMSTKKQHQPGGQKQPSMLWSSQTKLVSGNLQVSMQGDPYSSYTIVGGQCLAAKIRIYRQTDGNYKRDLFVSCQKRMDYIITLRPDFYFANLI